MLGVSDGTRPWYFAARVHARADSAADANALSESDSADSPNPTVTGTDGDANRAPAADQRARSDGRRTARPRALAARSCR